MIFEGTLPVAILFVAIKIGCAGVPELTSYKEILPYLQIFTSNLTGNYSTIISDPLTNSLIVGAKDRLLRLNANTLTELEYVEIPSKSLTRQDCLRIPDDDLREECHNYIKILHRVGDRIFVCGTNSLDPLCWWRQLNNLHQSLEEMDGKGRAPYALSVDSTSMFTSDGNYYVGTWLDTTGQDSVFYRSLGDSPFLRTLQANDDWLKRAKFVATYEIGEFVYFFFREIASEDTSFGNVAYSRVARVCKNDRGGNFMYENVWITYRKARVACTLRKDQEDRIFDRLMAVHFDKASHTFLMAFTSDSASDLAVCSYDLPSIERAFDGPVKYYVNEYEIYVAKANPYSTTNICEARRAAFNSTILFENMITAATNYQSMQIPILSARSGPIFHQNGFRLSHMIAHVVSTGAKNTTFILYALSRDGIMQKIHYVLGGNAKACLIESIYLNDGGTIADFSSIEPTVYDNKIRDLQFSADNTAIYVLRDADILKMEVLRCERHKTQQACRDSMDVYCGWDSIYGQCSPRPTVHSNLQYWRANTVSCQALDSMPREVYSDWRDWKSCDVTGPLRYGDNCMCRKRTCLATQCSEPTIQISNCTAHGGWTKWSEWSACSHSCGFALRYRQRSCSNPTPRFGGLPCVGKARDEEFCGENPPCPEMKPDPVHGGWSDWGDWNACSRRCGIGLQNRSRSCNDPHPQFGGDHCLGCDSEHRLCNTQPCKGLTKISNWTNWYVVNSSLQTLNKLDHADQLGNDNGEPIEWYKEMRLKFACRTIPRSNQGDQLVMKPAMSEYRICSTQGPPNSCTKLNTIGVGNAWSSWTVWSKCSSSCGQGTQYRNRSCDSSSSDSANACLGVSSQSRPCQSNTSCSTDDANGWEAWSSWTKCDVNNEESRFRICRTRNPGPHQCLGLNVEKRSCKLANLLGVDDQAGINEERIARGDEIADNSILAQPYNMVLKEKHEIPHPSPLLPTYQLVTGCVVAFLCGILITGALFAAWYRKRFRDCFLRQQKHLLFGGSNGHGHHGTPFQNHNHSLVGDHLQSSSILAPFKKVMRNHTSPNFSILSTTSPNGNNNNCQEKDILFGAPTPPVIHDGESGPREATLLRRLNHHGAGGTLKATNSFKTVGRTAGHHNPEYDRVNHYYQIHRAANGSSTRNINRIQQAHDNHHHICSNNNDSTTEEALKPSLDKFTLISPYVNNCYYKDGGLEGSDFPMNPYNAATLLRGGGAHLATLHGNQPQSLEETNAGGGDGPFGTWDFYGLKIKNSTNNPNLTSNDTTKGGHNKQRLGRNPSRYNAYSSLPRLKKEASFKESTIKRNELFPPHVYDDPF